MTSENQKRRNFRSSMVDDLDDKLTAWRRQMNLSVADTSRLMTKVFDQYENWTSVHEHISEMLNGRGCSDTLAANLYQLMKEVKTESTIKMLLRNKREGFRESPVGQTLKSRVDLFKSRKDLGGRFVLKHMKKAM